MHARHLHALSRRGLAKPRVRRGLALLVAAIGVSIGVPVFLAGGNVFSRLGGVPAWVLGGAPALMLAAWCANGVRVSILADANGYRLMPSYAWLIGAGGDFGASLGPGGVTGIAAYAYLLARTGLGSATATALYAVEKLLDQIIFAAALTASAIILALLAKGTEPWALFEIAFGICIGFLILIVIMLLQYRRMIRALTWLATQLRVNEHHRRHFIRWGIAFRNGLTKATAMPRAHIALLVLAAAGYWTARFAILPLVALGLGAPVPWGYLIAVQILTMFAGQVSFLPGGTLTVEVVFAALLLPWMDRASLGLMLLVWRGSVFYFTLVGGGMAFVAAVLKRRTLSSA
ncbi:MAG: lysylphosphatidylglycerol synthase transmembrane domain-containing protein [Gammaproteobacteria bacterium]